MNKISSKCMLLLLLIMTACIVFLPQFVSGQNESSLLHKKIYRNRDMQNSTKITGEQVAKIFYNREISISTSHFTPLEEGGNISFMMEKTLASLEHIFGDNELIYDHIKTIIINGSSQYSQSSTLAKCDNQPIALHFIDVTVTDDDKVLKITYEEKTKTVTFFSYLASSYYMDYEYEDQFFGDSFEAAVRDYYENELKISQTKYYFLNEIVEKEGLKNYYTIFKMLQRPDADQEKIDAWVNH